MLHVNWKIQLLNDCWQKLFCKSLDCLWSQFISNCIILLHFFAVLPFCQLLLKICGFVTLTSFQRWTDWQTKQNKHTANWPHKVPTCSLIFSAYLSLSNIYPRENKRKTAFPLLEYNNDCLRRHYLEDDKTWHIPYSLSRWHGCFLYSSCNFSLSSRIWRYSGDMKSKSPPSWICNSYKIKNMQHNKNLWNVIMFVKQSSSRIMF